MAYGIKLVIGVFLTVFGIAGLIYTLTRKDPVESDKVGGILLELQGLTASVWIIGGIVIFYI